MKYVRNMITWVKRFGRINLKCNHDHWPGSSACSSHLPRPGLLQRVSLVTIKQKDLKEESKKISPHSLHCNFSIFAILYSILKYSAKVHQQLQTPRREQAEPVRRLSVASNNTVWGPKEWCWCKGDKITYSCQTWIPYIIPAPCMFDTRMIVF